MIYVVLGMHKSGTSLVAATLHRAGIPMGDFDISADYDDGNKWERAETKEINKQLLGDCGEYSVQIRPGRRSPSNPALAARARGLIFQCSRTHADWGFKDPRTLLAAGFWRALLPLGTRLILVYRDPDEVMAHYYTRYETRRTRAQTRRLLRDVLISWLEHNRAALDWVTSRPANSCVVSHHELLHGDGLRRLSDFCGRPLQDCRRMEWHRAKRENVHPWRELIHDDLREQCARMEKTLASLSARLSESREHTDGCFELQMVLHRARGLKTAYGQWSPGHPLEISDASDVDIVCVRCADSSPDAINSMLSWLRSRPRAAQPKGVIISHPEGLVSLARDWEADTDIPVPPWFRVDTGSYWGRAVANWSRRAGWQASTLPADWVVSGPQSVNSYWLLGRTCDNGHITALPQDQWYARNRRLIILRALRGGPRVLRKQWLETSHMESHRPSYRRLARLIDAWGGTPHDPPAAAGGRWLLIAPQLGGGGAEKQWALLASGLARNGHPVDLLVTCSRSGVDPEYMELLPASGVHVIYAADQSPPCGGAALLDALSPDASDLLAAAPTRIRNRLWRVASWVLHLRPAFIVSQLNQCNILAGISAMVAGTPRVIFSLRNLNPSATGKKHELEYRRLYRSLARQPVIRWTGNAGGANADFARWLAIDPARIRHIPNGLQIPPPSEPVESREAIRASLGLPAHCRVILGAFRLVPQKNPRLFFETVSAMMDDDGPPLHVCWAGAGLMEPDIRRWVAASPHAGRIHLLGRRRDMMRIIPAADLVLLVSEAEGMPNILMEAQYLGVPVVATDVGGVRECVRDGVTGFLRPRGDGPGLVAACRSLLSDEARRARMGHDAHRFAAAFTLERMVDAYIEEATRPS